MTQILAVTLMVAGGAVALIAVARLFIRLAPWIIRKPRGQQQGLAHKLLNRRLKPTMIWEIAAAVLGYMTFRMGSILASLN